MNRPQIATSTLRAYTRRKLQKSGEYDRIVADAKRHASKEYQIGRCSDRNKCAEKYITEAVTQRYWNYAKSESVFRIFN